MPTKRPNERYLGQEMRIPISEDGQVAAYVWPVRIVRIGGVPCGGPTVGIDVRNQEVARFDCHQARGHWHGGLYDPENPNASQKSFPEGLAEVPDQVAWAFGKIRDDAADLVRAAEFGDEADGVQPEMVSAAVEALSEHLAAQGDLRGKAIADNLIRG
ncbi:MAG: hypothetical protein OXN15_06395 [Chloroflexota bacterium]|nr:hypothetical protein [Chloroflexota bacterium]MDE2969843.1 hypothetical protein [Chloroflexota bacterium]